MHQHVITITHHSDHMVTKVIGCYGTLTSSLLNKKTVFLVGAVLYQKNTGAKQSHSEWEIKLSEHNFIKVTRGSFTI